MKEKIYTSEQMRRNLENGLNNAARKLEALQKVAARDLPGSVWCNNFIWALAQYPDIKFPYRERILKDKAAQLGLICDFGAVLVSEDVKLNRKLVELEARQSLEAISEFLRLSDIHTYLRAGAIYIDEKGTVKIAADASKLIETFCSVYIESAKEKAFIDRLNALQGTAKRLEELHSEFVNSIEVPGGKEAAKWCTRYYMSDRFELVQGLHLNAPNMIWRAFIAFCTSIRKNDSPHFYNKAGIPEISVAELYKLTGYKPDATPELRIKFPELYKDEPYRNFIGSVIFDDTDGVETIRKQLKTRGYSIDNRGRLVSPYDSRYSRFVVGYSEEGE